MPQGSARPPEFARRAGKAKTKNEAKEIDKTKNNETGFLFLIRPPEVLLISASAANFSFGINKQSGQMNR